MFTELTDTEGNLKEDDDPTELLGCSPELWGGTVSEYCGSAPLDAGTAPEDSGSAPLDAGTAPEDSGSAPLDVGTTPEESGPTPLDAGADAEDAGVVPCELPGTTPLDNSGFSMSPYSNAAKLLSNCSW
jgi:hypothetical protein